MTSRDHRRVSFRMKGHVAWIELDRSEKRNAVDDRMVAGLIRAAASVEEEQARAVVLGGDGPDFCAGLDVASFGSTALSDPETLILPRTHGDANDFQQMVLAWHRLSVPVVAVLHGACFGAGMQLALGADIRIAAPDLRMAIMEMKWGLVPDMGSSLRLPWIARSDVVRLMTYTADPVAAEQALAWGLVTEIHEDPTKRAFAIANKIAERSPTAIKAAKALINLSEGGASQSEILTAESAAQAALIGRQHQMEAVSANLSGRRPKFG